MSATSVEAIKQAIASLSQRDRLALVSGLNLQTMDAWDQEMMRDFSPGVRGAPLVEKIQGKSARRT
ncbi:MAG TPA: hypothetical protein VEV17_13305 [Bryobacteraceae bacterium]|nr:hypothetical protein [Bryobacteraceae bacterium]